MVRNGSEADCFDWIVRIRLRRCIPLTYGPIAGVEPLAQPTMPIHDASIPADATQRNGVTDAPNDKTVATSKKTNKINRR